MSAAFANRMIGRKVVGAAVLLIFSLGVAAKAPSVIVEFLDLSGLKPGSSIRVTAACHDDRAGAIWLLAEERAGFHRRGDYVLHLLQLELQTANVASRFLWHRNAGPPSKADAVFCNNDSAEVSVVTWDTAAGEVLFGRFSGGDWTEVNRLTISKLGGAPIHVGRTADGFVLVSTTTVTMLTGDNAVDQWSPMTALVEEHLFGLAVSLTESKIAGVLVGHHKGDYESAILTLIDLSQKRIDATAEISMPYRSPSGLAGYLLLSGRDGHVLLLSPPEQSAGSVWRQTTFDGGLNELEVKDVEFVPFVPPNLQNSAVALGDGGLVLAGIKGHRAWIGRHASGRTSGEEPELIEVGRYFAVRELILLAQFEDGQEAVYVIGSALSVDTDGNDPATSRPFLAVVKLRP